MEPKKQARQARGRGERRLINISQKRKLDNAVKTLRQKKELRGDGRETSHQTSLEAWSGDLLLSCPFRPFLLGVLGRVSASLGQVLLRIPFFLRPPDGRSGRRGASNGLHLPAFAGRRFTATVQTEARTVFPAASASLPLLCLLRRQARRETAQTGCQSSSEARVWKPAPMLTPFSHPLRDLLDGPRLSGARSLTRRPIVSVVFGEKPIPADQSLGPCTHLFPETSSGNKRVFVTCFGFRRT